MVIHPMLNISKYLNVNAIYLKSLGMKNLMQRVRKAYFLVILPEAKLISAQMSILKK